MPSPASYRRPDRSRGQLVSELLAAALPSEGRERPAPFTWTAKELGACVDLEDAEAIARLQGAPVPAAILETDVLPAWVRGYRPEDFDALCAAGEVIWVGMRGSGPEDGRIALYFRDAAQTLLPAPAGRPDSEIHRTRAPRRARGLLPARAGPSCSPRPGSPRSGRSCGPCGPCSPNAGPASAWRAGDRRRDPAEAACGMTRACAST